MHQAEMLLEKTHSQFQSAAARFFKSATKSPQRECPYTRTYLACQQSFYAFFMSSGSGGFTGVSAIIPPNTHRMGARFLPAGMPFAATAPALRTTAHTGKGRKSAYICVHGEWRQQLFGSGRASPENVNLVRITLRKLGRGNKVTVYISLLLLLRTEYASGNNSESFN
jgi:hypothetical protein